MHITTAIGVRNIRKCRRELMDS